MLCERYGWTLEYVRGLELKEFREIVEVTIAMKMDISK